MSEKKLGRGLDFLIKRTTPQVMDAAAEAQAGPMATTMPSKDAIGEDVLVDSIQPNPYQPRREFAAEALSALTESIRQHGILQPIAIRPRAGGGYELISGERRWRACQKIGRAKIPAVIHHASDQEMLELALVENIQREDLDPMEKARAYRQMMREFELTQEQVAKRVSQKRSTVANFLRLLELPEEIQSMVQSQRVSMGHARALLSIENQTEQRQLALAVSEEKLTVRAIEEIARKQQSRGDHKTRSRQRSPHLEAIERQLEEAFGTKVRLQGSLSRGKVVVEYFDSEGLQHVMDVVARRT
jgi:ParB family chromosome partitioning protein